MPVKIIGGASTTSRRPDRMLVDDYSDYGCGISIQTSKHGYVKDWQQGLHGNIYGYAPDWWKNALYAAVRLGPVTSLRDYGASYVAQLLGEFYPDIEAVRFMCNGSDPCAAAVKLARAVTGRDKILCYGYHGTASAYATPPEVNARPNMPAIDMRRGTLQAERDAFVPLEWDDYCAVDLALNPRVTDDIAAVIVECPPHADMLSGGDATDWLQVLAMSAKNYGALFVLDEVVTGFRYGSAGASGYYDLTGKVDLYCFGKTLGNGFEVAALAGREEIMQELTKGVHFSGTFFGEPIGLAAARATLERLKSDPPWQHLYRIGNYLKDQWNALDLPYKLIGHPTRPIINDATLDDAFTDLRRYLFEQGHLVVDHPWYVTTATTEADVDDLVDKAGRWAR